MLVADGWADYELLDSGGGERLERWGKHLLIRPDPTALWARDKQCPGWTNPDARYQRSSTGGGRWEFRQPLPDVWVVRHGSLAFRVRPTGFKHMGLFPEQSANWTWIDALIRRADRPISVLNLFAYTGGATVAAAAAGATVCHVDAAKGAVAWARENLAETGLTGASVRWITDDAFKFIERELRRGRRYDAIAMDPPSYGRGPGGETWKFEKGIVALLASAARLLSDRPLFFLLNAYTTGLSPVSAAQLLHGAGLHRPGVQTWAGELALRDTRRGWLLPCGVVARTVWADGGSAAPEASA
ncbi:MAG: class I SAM-dependent methyltransferase [Verrucomicrobiia bacterium]